MDAGAGLPFWGWAVVTQRTLRCLSTLPRLFPRQNEILWREVVTLRQSHGQQHRVIGKVFLFPHPTPERPPPQPNGQFWKPPGSVLLE